MTYSVRCLYLWADDESTSDAHVYEERITIWNAQTAEEALEYAEVDARKYAKQNDVKYLSFAQIYVMSDEMEASGQEVFSLLRESKLDSAAYITAFFDCGTERERNNV